MQVPRDKLATYRLLGREYLALDAAVFKAARVTGATIRREAMTMQFRCFVLK